MPKAGDKKHQNCQFLVWRQGGTTPATPINPHSKENMWKSPTFVKVFKNIFLLKID